MSESEDPVVILHVDDEPDVTELTATFLERERERFSVRTANTVDNGLELLSESAVDCIVSDYDMPGTNGIEFLEAVRGDFPDLPFILYTGKGSEEVASEAISAGVTDYLQKASGSDQYAVLANRIENAVERYRTERALQATRRRYEKVVENNLAGIYIIQDGEFVYVNPKLAEIHGYPRDEIIGMSPLELVASAERDRVEENLRKRLDGEIEEIQYETVGLTKDGEHIEIELHGSHVEYAGKPAVIGAELDISERKERERELERYEAIVENSDDGVYVFDEDGCFEFVNRRVAQIARIPREDWIGRHVSILSDLRVLSENEVRTVENGIRKAANNEETEIRITLQPDLPDDIRDLELRLTPLRTDEGKTRVIGFSRDVTDQQERTE